MTVHKLNELLGQELGRNIYSQPIFVWKWSEDLIWPTTFTGRMVNKKIDVPLIGGGTAKASVLVKEFKPRRMTNKYKNCWIVCKWLSPAELVGLRLGLKIGDEPKEIDIPREIILRRWNDLFPGADYPERGWYIHTNYANLPNVKPALDDTKFLIAQLRSQLSDMSIEARYRDIIAADDSKRAGIRAKVEDICENEFTAFLNPEPGRRGHFVSFGGAEEKDFTTKENPQHG